MTVVVCLVVIVVAAAAEKDLSARLSGNDRRSCRLHLAWLLHITTR